MKLIIFLFVIFLIIGNEDFERNQSVVAAEIHQIPRKNYLSVKSIDVFIERLKNIIIDVNFISLHDLLNEELIDEYSIANEVFGASAEFDLKTMLSGDNQKLVDDINKELDEYVEGLKALTPFEVETLKNQTKVLKEMQSSNIEGLARKLENVFKSFKFTEKMKALKKVNKLERSKSEIDEMLTAMEETSHDLKTSQKNTTDFWGNSEKFQEIHKKFIGNTEKWKQFLEKELEKNRLILGNTEFDLQKFLFHFWNSSTIINSSDSRVLGMFSLWNTAEEKIGNLIHNTKEIRKEPVKYELIHSFLKNIIDPEPESSRFIVGFQNKEFDSINVDDYNHQNIITVLIELSKIRKDLSDISMDYIPDLEEIRYSIEFIRNNPDIVRNAFERFSFNLAAWDIHDGYKNLTIEIESFKKNMNDFKSKLSRIIQNSEIVQKSMTEINSMLNVKNDSNVNEVHGSFEYFSERLPKLQGLVNETKFLYEECAEISKNLDDLDDFLNSYQSFLEIKQLDMNRLNEINFDLIEKVLGFAGEINKIGQDESNHQIGFLLNNLTGIKEKVETLQKYCEILKVPQPKFPLTFSTQTMWKLDYGIRAIQDIRKMIKTQQMADSSDKSKMIIEFVNSMKQIENEKEVGSLRQPLNAALEFRSMLTDQLEDFNWIRFYEDIDGIVGVLPRIESMYKEDDSQTTSENPVYESTTISDGCSEIFHFFVLVLLVFLAN